MFRGKHEILAYLQEKLKSGERYLISITSEKDYIGYLENEREGIIKAFPVYKDKIMALDIMCFDELGELYQQELESGTENPYQEAMLMFLEVFNIK